MTVNLDDLDRCIKAIENVRARPIVRIYLNPDDWRKARTTMEILTTNTNVGRIPENTAFGVPVILSSALGRGQYIMEYETLGGPQLVGWSKQ